MRGTLSRLGKAAGLGVSGVAALALGLSSGMYPVVASAGESEEQEIVVDGSTTVGPVAKAFAEHYMERHPEINITVSESGSGNGAKSLINRTCHVATMSRFMKESEFEAAVQKGVLPFAHVVAMDALAVIVHPANPVSGLTLDQIRDVYLGTITNWSQLGGPEKKIVVISRDTNSGTFETFENVVMRKEKMAPRVEYVGSNGALRQRVQITQAAIGYLGLGFVDRTVKALTINGIAAEKETVASGEYPIARPLFMFTDGYPEAGTHLHAFVTFYLTAKGQQIIEAIGYVPVTDY